MAEIVIGHSRHLRGGPDTFTVWVEGERKPRRLDENPHYPRGETPRNRLTVAEADALPVSEWGFEMEVVGEGTMVTEVHPTDPSRTRQRFQGVVAGYNWRAATPAMRDAFEVRWREDQTRERTITRNGLSGQVRFPSAERIDPSRIEVQVERKVRRIDRPTRTARSR